MNAIQISNKYSTFNPETRSERLPFTEIKFQWLALLSKSPELSDSAKTIALYIVTNHFLGAHEVAWPSFATIAEAIGKDPKTVKRGVDSLVSNHWFVVERGNGRKSTSYRPTELSGNNLEPSITPEMLEELENWSTQITKDQAVILALKTIDSIQDEKPVDRPSKKLIRGPRP